MERIGVNHAIVGGFLTQRWNLSKHIYTMIEHHHYPSFFGINDIPEEYIEDVAIVCISDLIVNRFEHPENPLKYPHPRFYELLGLDPDIDRAVTPELSRRLDRAGRFLNGLE